jgi:hypothetical protein
MAKKDEYRNHAGTMVRLASHAGSNADKARLLAMAEAWLDLADRVDSLIRRQALKVIEFPSIQPGIRTEPGGSREAC